MFKTSKLVPKTQKLQEWSLITCFFFVQNLKSDLSLWQLGTLPPGLIAFHGYVHIIDPFWHMLGLGYQENTSIADVQNAAVIHFNGRAKPWLDIAFPQLRALWTKYVNFSDKFIKSFSRLHLKPILSRTLQTW